MKTQKAKGIIKGLEEFFNTNSHRDRFLNNPDHILIETKDDIETNFNNWFAHPLPAFARPCPKTPKHGFIESRTINTKEELVALWKEVKKEDQHGEIILGEHFDEVSYNAIYVSSGQLSIGKGNDGATGGKNSINFPVAPFKFTKTFRKKIGVKETDTIYIEAIKATREYDYESFWHLTQMRGGPSIKGSAVDYVPFATKVKKVIIPSNNLLEWEKTCKKMEAGTVVYGNGYTLASHAGVHCIINKIPFITSTKPKVGETLKPVANETPKLSIKSFRKGVNMGTKLMKDMEPAKAFYFSVSVLHNWAHLRNSEYADYLLGAASSIYAQLCSAMIFGEQRHCSVCQKDSDYSREEVYNKVFLDIRKNIPKISKIVNCFNLHNWDDGYGGLPWAICSWHTYALWKTITKVYSSRRKFMKDADITQIIGSINNTTNLAHHNGWWFNKFVEKEDMDFLAEEAGIAALSVADIYFEIHQNINKIKAVSNNFVNTTKIKEPFSKDKNGKGVWCVATFEKGTYYDEYNRVYIKTFREHNNKEGFKSIKYSSNDFKVLLNKAKKKGLSSVKTINLPFVKEKVILPDGKKVSV